MDIISVIRATPPVEPAKDFTARVMARLPERPWRSPIPQGPLGYLTAKSNLFSDRPTPKECAFCFLTAGFFYLAAGIVVFFGLGGICDHLPVFNWLMLQPAIAVVFGIGLSALGFLLLRNTAGSVNAAYYGVSLYIAVVVADGVALLHVLGSNAALLAIAPFATAAVLTGIFLGSVVQDCRRGTPSPTSEAA